MRRTPRPIRTLTAATGCALLLALTACGGDSEPSGGEPDSASSESTSATGDQPADGEEVEPGAFVDDMKAGLEASTTARMSMTVDAAGAGIDAEGQVDYTTEPPSMAMTMTSPMMGEEPIDMRLVDGVMYMNMGKMSQGKFVSFDLSDGANLPPGMSGLADQMDPLAAFEEFEPGLKSVTFVGNEDVDGEELARYQIVLDPSKVKSLQGLPASAGLPEEIDADLWFDDEFRMRQMTMELDAAQPVTIETRLFEWGEPVEIEAPPADQVVDPSTTSG